MADGTSVVSDRWGTSAGPRALRERSQYASRLRLPAAAENRRNCSQVSPCAGRLPSGRGPNADRPFDEPTTSTARRVAAATWMMSSTTVASRAYAVVPARRSRWSRGGASRPSSAPAAGSARHRADASRRDRAARSPDPQPASCRRSFRRGFRARAAPSTRHRWCPRPDQQPLSGCVGRDVLAGACVPNPGAAGAVPVRVRSRSSAGLRWTRGRLWHPRRQHRPLRTGLGSGDRCKGRRFAARRMYVPGILSSQPSQVCLPSHGTVPERRANVQKGARPRGTDRRCSVPFRGSAGRRKDAGTRWLGCCPPERSTGETHPRAKKPMNRAKTPLRRRAAPPCQRRRRHSGNRHLQSARRAGSQRREDRQLAHRRAQRPEVPGVLRGRAGRALLLLSPADRRRVGPLHPMDHQSGYFALKRSFRSLPSATSGYQAGWSRGEATWASHPPRDPARPARSLHRPDVLRRLARRHRNGPVPAGRTLRNGRPQGHP